MRTMTKYTPEQRRDAVQMLKDFGAQKAQEALGIPPTTLYRWKKQVEEKKEWFHRKQPSDPQCLEDR